MGRGQELLNLVKSIKQEKAIEACERMLDSVESMEDYTDATATEKDIQLGKTAYAGGKRITGTSTARETDCDCQIDFLNNTLAGSTRTLSEAVRKIDLTNTDLTGTTSLARKFSGYRNLREAKINMKGIKDASNLFEDCTQLKTLIITNTQDLENVSFMFDDNRTITETFEFDTSNVKNFTRMYQNCKNLVTIKKMDCSSAVAGFDQFFYTNFENIRNIEGFVNYGKAFTEKQENYSAYTMNLNPASGLTREAIVNVFNNLYDLNLTYDVANGGKLYTQHINLGYTLGAKITAEDRKIATNKGWNIYG